MKKENIYKWFYFISILLILGFIIRVVADYLKYNAINNSAPFYAFIIARIVEFLLPSAIIFIVGKKLKKKYSE